MRLFRGGGRSLYLRFCCCSAWFCACENKLFFHTAKITNKKEQLNTQVSCFEQEKVLFRRRQEWLHSFTMRGKLTNQE